MIDTEMEAGNLVVFGKSRQRLGVRWPSTAFRVHGSQPKRQRTGALQNLAAPFTRIREWDYDKDLKGR